MLFIRLTLLVALAAAKKSSNKNHEGMAETAMAALDTDNDGKLTRQELTRITEATDAKSRKEGKKKPDAFRDMDANRDGFVTLKELAETFRTGLENKDNEEEEEERHPTPEASVAWKNLGRAPRS